MAATRAIEQLERSGRTFRIHQYDTPDVAEGGYGQAVAGILVLLGALATSRMQRLREGALLKTLGARRRQVLAVLFAEYLALGTLATAAGLVLAVVAAAIMLPTLFELSYTPAVHSLGLVWGGVVGLTVLVGLLGSRDLLNRPPLPVLREAPEITSRNADRRRSRAGSRHGCRAAWSGWTRSSTSWPRW